MKNSHKDVSVSVNQRIEKHYPDVVTKSMSIDLKEQLMQVSAQKPIGKKKFKQRSQGEIDFLSTDRQDSHGQRVEQEYFIEVTATYDAAWKTGKNPACRLPLYVSKPLDPATLGFPESLDP